MEGLRDGDFRARLAREGEEGGMLGQLHHANDTHKTPQALANPTSDNPSSTLIMAGNRQTGNKKKDEGRRGRRRRKLYSIFRQDNIRSHSEGVFKAEVGVVVHGQRGEGRSIEVPFLPHIRARCQSGSSCVRPPRRHLYGKVSLKGSLFPTQILL